MSLQELIAPLSDRLTPTERRIASIVLEDPTLLAFGTVSDLADKAETSRPSIVRFATKLGFEGYTDLQNWIRDQFATQLASPSHRVRQQDSSSGPIRRAIDQAVDAIFQSMDAERLDRLAQPIADAQHVWILSGETSLAGAHALQSGLSMARPGVLLVEEHSTGRDLSGASSKDVAVVFDFPRYRKFSITTAQTLHALGVQIVAVTDGPLSPLVPIASQWCELRIPAVGPFDSSVPAVLMSELLVSRVVKQLGDEARERIDQLEAFWQATDIYLQYSPRLNREQ